jgi:hypothetical protein
MEWLLAVQPFLRGLLHPAFPHGLSMLAVKHFCDESSRVPLCDPSLNLGAIPLTFRQLPCIS